MVATPVTGHRLVPVNVAWLSCDGDGELPGTRFLAILCPLTSVTVSMRSQEQPGCVSVLHLLCCLPGSGDKKRPVTGPLGEMMNRRQENQGNGTAGPGTVVP